MENTILPTHYRDADNFCHGCTVVLYDVFRDIYPELRFSKLYFHSKSFLIYFGEHCIPDFNAISIAVPVDNVIEITGEPYIYETALYKNDVFRRYPRDEDTGFNHYGYGNSSVSKHSSIKTIIEEVAHMYSIYKRS
jgi:hypothetical protein